MSLQRTLLACSLVLGGCAPEVILVAEGDEAGPLDAGQDADAQEAEAAVEAGRDEDALAPHSTPDAGRDGGGFTCYGNDCPRNMYCAKPRCTEPGQVQLGTCMPKPRREQCDSEFAPVCGCNGMSYYNDCLRQADGVNREQDFWCSLRATYCGFNAGPCPSGTFCALQMSPQASCDAPATEGRCWSLPNDCSGSRSGGDQVQRCNPRSGERECVSACDAIREQAPYVLSPTCMRRPPTFP